MILLDTHIWLWWLLNDGNLKQREREELHSLASKNRIAISWVTIWETEMLERKGRIELRPNLSRWIALATKPEVSIVLPADIEVVLAQRKLPQQFHSDPADRLITATSVLSGYPLATHDGRIRTSKACEIWNSG